MSSVLNDNTQFFWLKYLKKIEKNVFVQIPKRKLQSDICMVVPMKQICEHVLEHASDHIYARIVFYTFVAYPCPKNKSVLLSCYYK